MSQPPGAARGQDDDPLVTKYVDAALEPYRDTMPPEDLEVFRARLYVYYETDPEAVALLDEIRGEQQKAPVVARSGERAVLDDAALEKAAQRLVRGGKGGAR